RFFSPFLFPEVVLIALLLLLQAQAPLQPVAQTISPEDIRRRIGIIADDSMRGRDTPSPELDKVARYIAGEYRRFGLKPGGDRGTFIQRYALDRVKILGDSSVAFVHGGPGATLKYGSDFFLANNMFASGDYAGELVLVSGPLSGATADTASLAGKMIILTTPRLRAADRDRVFGWKPAGVVFVNGTPDSAWNQVVSRVNRPQLRDPGRSVGDPLVLVIRAATVGPVLTALGADYAGGQNATTFAVQPLGGAQLHVHARIQPVERNSAPNVVGILEGSDPVLKNEYVVFSAHMDHVGVAGPRGSGGCRAQGADSICNGADDDGSGTAAVVEIAEAFARLNPRPKRSIIFLNVSGEEKGLWGSQYFTNHPAAPINNIVADLNIDMIGRNWKDTIVAIGKEHSDLGATLNRIGAAHPELNMRPIDDIWPQESFYTRSDHYNFARKGVPILFFFSGVHDDYHKVTDSPEKIDAEKESRVARLIFYLGVDIANAAERPKWNPDSYKRIVAGN
ncbi:MAG TPA: M20/M25/M40 family metallo-hydrolase, partial [Gemmatimonadales bacterium]|nr:M20/M25/M40 family metallo-hydrolase [Gemmatimonadales bacterium]